MNSGDYGAFSDLLNTLGIVFDKQITDELRKLYWESLKDVPFPYISRAAMGHQKHGKFFPKPKELRPADERPAKLESEAEHNRNDAKDRECAAAWDAYLKRDPEEARLRLKIARAFRIMASTHPSNPIYAEAKREDWQAQQLLLALWERRRNARKVQTA